MTPAERFHTQQRLLQRYGLRITSAQLFQFAKRLAHGEGVLLARQSRFVAQWQLMHEGRPIRFVFDRQRRSILTALPLYDSEAYAALKQARA